MTRKLAIIAIALWVISALVAGVMFARGNGHKGTDGRILIRLAPDERDFVLSEMRGMLIAMQDISAALAKAAPEFGSRGRTTGWQQFGRRRSGQPDGQAAAGIQTERHGHAWKLR